MHAARRLLVSLCLLPAALLAQQVRDVPVKPPPGTATISGVAVIGEAGHTPARRARVTLNTPTMFGSHSTIADDEGRFAFTGVQADRFTLAARKDGYISASYGAKRAGKPGVPLIVKPGAHMDGLVIRLLRGGVITGRVLDPNGEPGGEARVQAFRVRTIDGERRLESGSGSVMADDRGTYRIASLLPGEYIVAATWAVSGPAGLRQMSDREIQAALQRPVPAPVNAGPRAPGAMGSSPAAPPLPPAGDIIFAPIYFPSAISPLDATVVRVASGEERTGVDVLLQPVRAARVEGTVIDPFGGLTAALQVTLQSANPLGVASSRTISVPPASGGGFVLPAVVPGTYVLRAQLRLASAPGPAGGPTPGPASLWAQTEVTVAGADISGLSLVLQPAPRIGGRVILEGTARESTAADAERIRVTLRSAPMPGGGPMSFMSTSAATGPDGTFTFPSVTPGRYLLTASYAAPGTPGAPPPAMQPWIVTSVRIGDAEHADVPFDVAAGQTMAPIVIRLADRASEITGMLQDASANPAFDYYVVVFPADRALWRGQRRLLSLRPSSDGQYAARNLPAGDYLIAAVTDMEASDLSDAEFLEQLVPAAVRIRLADGESKVQHLRVAR